MRLMKIVLLSFIIIIILSQNIFALGDILTTGESWIGTGKNKAGIGISTSNLKQASGELYNILLAIATVIAVIVGAILGVRYMTAGIDEKVKVKESLFPYLISCIVVFGSLGIWKLVVTIMKTI